MYSKKQRADIYLKAAEKIFNNSEPGCCWAIMTCVKPRAIKLNRVILDLFGEFYLFEPVSPNYAFWWGNTSSKEANNERILALLFARAIALNP